MDGIATGGRRVDEGAALRAVVEGTAAETGTAFYRALVRNLASSLGTAGAWLTELDETGQRLRAVAFWCGDRFVEGHEYAVAGTPCQQVIDRRGMVLVGSDLGPGRGAPPGIPEMVSYLGVPLMAGDGRILGLLSVVDLAPIAPEERLLTLFRLFATRAVAEMRREALERELRDRQEKLALLIGSALDAIVELDERLEITLVNAAAETLFGVRADAVRGLPVAALLGERSAARLAALRSGLEADRARQLWIPDGLVAEPAGRRPFPAEATLSRYEVRGRPYHTLILRNVDERLEAERRIRALTATADDLRDALAEGHGFDDIVGRSEALREALRGVIQVAPTDATVLVTGETGTGKELFARALHERSGRREGPLVKVNCAAVPAALMESEFFGHERGAFTGATQRREGRFALADGGTIFLDEIGELPVELQGKLLRVLQEGEFEPVGSSRTRRVDVRVVAATNRDLEADVRAGTFREDLFYRLSVFPLRLPPLRERGDDAVLLAETLARRLARSMGKVVAPPGAADAAALRAYPWPGNVRELRNVIERALILSVDGRLHLDRILPAPSPAAEPPAAAPAEGSRTILTDGQLRALERENTRAALERCGWRVGGEGGAAELLGLSPSTLKSRLRGLGLQRGVGGADAAAP
ncbi:MAG: sigma 54-interacting transcriptional regulator [Anaeromyxobacter sp.]